MVWVHWVLYNLPPSANGLAEGVKVLPENAKVGLNDWKRAAYGGPCPPIGRHRYFHKLYALDVVPPNLGLEGDISGNTRWRYPPLGVSPPVQLSP